MRAEALGVNLGRRAGVPQRSRPDLVAYEQERRVDARDAVTVVPAREAIFAQARRLWTTPRRGSLASCLANRSSARWMICDAVTFAHAVVTWTAGSSALRHSQSRSP